MFGGKIGLPEIVLILFIVLIVFGVGKLPNIGKSLGQSIREFKAATKDDPKESTAKNDSDTKASSSKEDKA
jgi:sec-independent protein translocase protein TatA